jgi:carotenoid cleavage dioxygenase-like enzyme
VDTQVAYFTVSASGHKSQSYPVDVQAAQVMHDFAATESYAVFVDHALIFDPQHMVKEKSLPFRCVSFTVACLFR